MFTGVCGDYYIADIDFRAKRTGNSCVDHRIHRKQIRQKLHADACIDFSDAALDNDNILSVQYTFMELHASLVHDIFQRHL